MTRHPRILPLLAFLLLSCISTKDLEGDNDNGNEEGDQQGDCIDGEDNDGDGDIDCLDDGCSNKPACSEENSSSQYGPDNDWYHAPENSVQEPSNCGYNEGDTACNFTMVDQNGDDVELYQFWGLVIVLDVYAEW